MKIAVTGGAGFIGSHVVDRLVRDDHEVIVVDVRSPERDDVSHVVADILDRAAMKAAFGGCDVVFHLAAVADVNTALARPADTIDLNVHGTACVWEAARDAGVQRTVLASTVWVYDAAVGPGPYREDTPFDLGAAGHVYTASKLASELVVRSSHRLYGQEFTILRYGIPYGPRMRPELVIAIFLKRILEGRPITINGDGSAFRRFVYVEDLADAHARCLGPAGANEVFNLEGSTPVTVLDIVNALSAVLERTLDVEHLPARPGDFAGGTISAEKALSRLGWEATTPFREGLRRYVEWFLRDGDGSQFRTS